MQNELKILHQHVTCNIFAGGSLPAELLYKCGESHDDEICILASCFHNKLFTI